MKSIDLLEHGGGHFHVRHNGELVSLPDPRAQHYQWVLMALHLCHVPGTPKEIADWKRRLVFDRWCAAWDLPNFDNARRLSYLVDNYRPSIAYDLHVHAHSDLGELWRARRWQMILDILDRLPAHSWYASSVSMDEEHAKMMAEVITARRAAGEEEKSDRSPSLTSWTPEVAALTNVLDAVRGVSYAVYASQAGDKAGKPPPPAPRPVTPLERALKAADHNSRKQKHEELVARLIRR